MSEVSLFSAIKEPMSDESSIEEDESMRNNLEVTGKTWIWGEGLGKEGW